jgi:archaemetzincin
MKYLYVGATTDIQSEADREAFTAARECLERPFGLPVREVELPPVDFSFDAARRQYSSIAVLEMLAANCPKDAARLLAVTGRDLFIPVLTFVYGQAQLDGRVGVVSLARLRQEFYGLPHNREALLRRAEKEALHEAGHLFGLVHCAERTCAMSLSTGVRQIDFKNAAYCAPCSARLRRKPRELNI